VGCGIFGICDLRLVAYNDVRSEGDRIMRNRPVNPVTYRVSTVAEMANVSHGTVLNWVRDGIVEAKRVGRLILIDAGSAHRLLGVKEAA
jgi:excisionase family DNA binding protein